MRKRAPNAVRIGLETGKLSNWLTLSLRRRGLPIVRVDARHAKAALQMQINKADAEPLLRAWQALRQEVEIIERQLTARANDNAATRRLMTVPGVGVIVALAIRDRHGGPLSTIGIRRRLYRPHA